MRLFNTRFPEPTKELVVKVAPLEGILIGGGLGILTELRTEITLIGQVTYISSQCGVIDTLLFFFLGGWCVGYDVDFTEVLDMRTGPLCCLVGLGFLACAPKIGYFPPFHHSRPYVPRSFPALNSSLISSYPEPGYEPHRKKFSLIKSSSIR